MRTSFQIHEASIRSLFLCTMSAATKVFVGPRHVDNLEQNCYSSLQQQRSLTPTSNQTQRMAYGGRRHIATAGSASRANLLFCVCIDQIPRELIAPQLLVKGSRVLYQVLRTCCLLLLQCLCCPRQSLIFRLYKCVERIYT